MTGISGCHVDIQFTLNGQAQEWRVASEDTLLDALRSRGWFGVKRGCDQGDCGACLVLINGEPVSSCQVFAMQVSRCEVSTIEGVAAGDELDPLQAAFLDHGAVQCGYCTPGMILKAEALLKKNPLPTEMQVREALSGNLCRCTGYKKIVEAVLAAAEHRQQDRAPSPSLIGRSVRKVDGVKLVTGRSAFTDDINMPGMLYAKILASPYAHARIRSIDTSKAKALAGVHAVLTYKDVPRVPHTTAGQAWPEPSPYDTYLLDNKVRFVGDRVAAVAAETKAIAEQALRLIEVDYEVLPAVRHLEKAMLPGAPVIHDEPDSTKIFDAAHNVAGYIFQELGDVERGFAESDLIFEHEFRTQRQQHAQLEPHITICWLDPDGRLVIRSSTQIPYHVRRQCAMILQIPVSRIHVIKPRIGGGFGGKQEMVLEDLCGALALATRRPVKLELTRSEEFYMTRSRHAQIIKMKMGVKRDGTMMATQMNVLASTGAYGSHATTVQGSTGSKVLPLYRVPNLRFECHVAYTNTPVSGAFRGYGCPQGFFAQESMMDEIAEALHMDPIELRRKNAIRLGDTDALSAQIGEGKVGLARQIRSCGLPECLSRGAAAIDWAHRRSIRNGDARIRRGTGMALTMQGSGIAGVDWASALLKMNEDGSFHLMSGAADVGAGADTVLSQIAAETLGVSLDKILITSGDTDTTPFDVGAYASSTTIISGGAVKKAAGEVRRQVLEHASRMLDAPPSRLFCRDNRVGVVGDPEKSVSMSEVALQAMYKDKTQIMGGASHSLSDSPPPFCATFATVEVDTQTGKVRVLDLVTAIDPGVAINPMQAEGQVEGAVTQGLGYALTEDMIIDDDGRMLNTSFKDYKILSAKDMPKLTTILVETEEPLGPYGAKSIAEVPINGPAPAIANAIFNAVGVRIRKLPIRPEAILTELQKKGDFADRECLASIT